jgi:hypothetical protein
MVVLSLRRVVLSSDTPGGPARRHRRQERNAAATRVQRSNARSLVWIGGSQ